MPECAGADVHAVVSVGMGLDGRTGGRQVPASRGGGGVQDYGGSWCFPKDTLALAHVVRRTDSRPCESSNPVAGSELRRRRPLDDTQTRSALGGS